MEPKDTSANRSRRIRSKSTFCRCWDYDNEIVLRNFDSTSGFDRTTWTPLLELSAREVFDIMLCTKLHSFEPPANRQTKEISPPWSDWPAVSAGSSASAAHDQAARIMASKMLGMPVEEVDNDSWDALGEIANMIAGNFKGKLSGVGNHCMLSVPTIITGTDYETRSITTDMLEAIFELRDIFCTLELHE